MTSSISGFGARKLIALSASIISVLALFVFLLPGSVFAAGTVYVDASAAAGGDGTSAAQAFQTIQAAVNAANAGDTIQVAAGTYTEAVSVGKSVTISGDSGAKLVVNTTTVNGISVTANDVTIQGLDIEGPANQSYTTFPWGGDITRGIVIADSVTNFTITHNTIANLRNDILINGHNSTGSVTSNTIDNSKSGISVQYTDGSGITISGNTEGTYGNDWGVNLHLNGHLDGTGAIIGSNTPPIAAVAPASVQTALLANSSANDGWTVQDQGYSTMNRTAVTVATTGGATAQGDPLGPIDTIQHGVNAVVTGGTVNVSPGTYSGDVTIATANLTIKGTGSVILNLGSGYGFDLDEPGNVATGFTMSGITVNASPSTTYAFKAFKADGLTLTNDTFNGGAGNTGGGVDLNTTSNATLDNVVVTGFHKNGFAVTSKYVSGDTAASNITFNNISSTNNGWNGIAFYTTNSAGTVGGSLSGVVFTGTNTISGNGTTGPTQGGIFIEGDSDSNLGLGHAPTYTVTSDGTTLDLTHVAFNSNAPSDIFNYQTSGVNAVGATFGGLTGNAMDAGQRSAEDGKIYDQLDNAAYGLVTYYTPAAPATVTVTIDAYVNGAQADTSNTASIAFPMHAIFPGGEGDYTLSTSGYNNPDAYKATTSDMPVGSDYSTYQTAAAAANKCTADYPFRLIGYGVGDTLADAQAAAPSATVPSFTNLTSDKFVVVFFKTCPPAPTPITPATSGTTVTNAELPKIDWSDVSDSLGPVSSYNYEVSNAPDTGAFGSFNNIVYSATLTSSENPNGGTPDGTYYWHEQAVDAAGHVGPWSPTMSITFNSSVPAGPSVPTNGAPNGTTLNTNNFDFTWDASTGTGPLTYEFQSSLNPAQTGGVLTTGLWQSGTLPSNMIHSSGAPDGTWYWQVRAKDAASAYSAWSPIWTVTLDHSTTTPDTTAPVVTVTPAAGSTLSGTVTFTITVTDNKPLDPSKLTHIWTYLYDNAGAQKSKGANVDLSSGTATFTVDTTLLDDGAATLDVGKLYDAAGNPSGVGDSYFKNYQISNGSTTPPVVANVTTNDATSVSDTDATLNGTIGSSDAQGHSFWVSSTTIDTSSSNIPADVYSTPDMGAASASSAFSALLSSLTATNGAVVSGGAQGTMPALFPGATYHYVAWANVGGTWFPGAEKTVTLGQVEGTSTSPTGHGAAPTANAQSITINQDASTTITFTGSDPEGDSLTYSIATPPAHGSLSAITGTDVTYTPTAGYSGGDWFTFTANDGSSTSAPATVLITINAAPPAPVTPSTLVVTPSAPQGWSTYGLTASGTVDFIAASDSPSAPGALELTTSNDVNSVTHFKKEASSTLSDVTSISFATKQIAAVDATNGNATLRLSIDLDGNGTEDDQLMYEPYYNGFAGGTNWNTWTITHSNGKFWSNENMTYNGLGGVSAGSYASNFTLADVLHDHPNAKLIGLIVSMGSYNVSQQVAVDNVHLVTATEDTTYNFEQDPASTSTGTGGGSGTVTSTSRSRSNSRSTTSSGSTGSTGSTGGQVLGASAFNFTRDLFFGLSGADVTELQTELIAAGYLHITSATGWFGSLTRAAVAQWQSEHGIFPAVGYFGPISRAKYSADGGFFLLTTPVTTTTSTTTATTTPSV